MSATLTMDLEHLTKHQILLLALLVSFVTSIATGIVTVSLMDQAPAGITRVINQIVERTVETVTPAGQSAGVNSATTVVVKDDDLAAQSIVAVQKSLIRITARGGEGLVARGIIIDNKGVALTDRTAILLSGATVFDAVLNSGERVPAVLRSTPADGSVAILDVVVGTSTGFEPATLGDASNLKLGQSVIRIGGSAADTVGIGVIASLVASGPDAPPSTVEASVGASTPGSILTTLFGEVIGMTTGIADGQSSTSYTTLNSVVNP